MRLARFIRDDAESILAEWETFARSIAPVDTMDVAALRDHAKEMLLVISADLERPQTDLAQDETARGERDAGEERSVTAAQEHGAGRAASGFSVGEMVAEFRALRASVTRLWISDHAAEAATDLEDLIRFNEAIDQAIAESVSRFSQTVAGTRDRFLAILSHDLRTPLGAIIASMHFMVDAGGLEEPGGQRGAARRGAELHRVTARGLDREVTFSVFNEGPAIPSADLAEIFRDGRRGGTTPVAQDGRHQGLGLYIVDRIVAAHGGTVSVRSSAGDGTTFSVRLPRHE